MTVTINDAAMNRFLRSTTGAVGQDLALRANKVLELASMNASGMIIGIRSGDLRLGLRARIEPTNVGLEAIVSTPAEHRDFFYPSFHDRNGRPWLTNALRDGFRHHG